ncbi:hypothetical protein H8356DRAFT_1277647 [Neocallimastix lanati (nom. inval.)]|jgi:hypothetical protein|uniref:SH3 domain-containing protein n=1 Tax=Neocallimastix californiae TaxID=1754190 RepID=A0A1Y2AVK7_9FUNG|nr:hypothetical protein H8356DRAFT_1277647 [Neocallimastix sp. JGI-2020a]ORY26623.1 hypothetical protein LY90DRAFT_674506 [Neocallimastix californiae]|eukprot:ORY26623.1 hypothetical protein LY90DRAFT_674506 [Neocallimastix californiae]
MEKSLFNKYFWFTLCIIFQTINIAYAEEWKIINPTKNMEYKEGNLSICWNKSNSSNNISSKNIIITLNAKNESQFKEGYILADNVTSDSKCYNYNIENLDSHIENGAKEILIWDSNKNFLAKSEVFAINKKTKTMNFGKASYVIIGAAIAIPVVLVLLFNYKKKEETIPTGSRSIPNLTVNRRKTYEPPIKSYRESWIELPKANISTDSIEDVYDHDLLEEAEEAAKTMGLLDKVWKAKKAFIPSREDELLIRVGDELIVKEIYDDLWCYGQNKTLFEEEEAKENKEIKYNNDISIQENEELAKFGMFPSVVLPIEFKNLKITKQTIQSIREASVVAEPIHDEVHGKEVILKQDPNSVVIKIPSPPENIILPVNNLKRSTSLRSSLHRRTTQHSQVSISSQPVLTGKPVKPLTSLPTQPPKLVHNIITDKLN